MTPKADTRPSAVEDAPSSSLSHLQTTSACPICSASVRAFAPHYFRCSACDYWFSTLSPDVTNTTAPDSEYDLVSYQHTRAANYTLIVERLKARHGSGSTLLEIGCADGLFMKLAHDLASFTCVGIEPNIKMQAGNVHRQDIRMGFFPQVFQGETPRFDIIALNDVLEHIPRLEVLIEDFKRHLNPGGTIAINVPASSGQLYRIATLLFRLGLRYPFRRLWQEGFVSPHLSYFSTRSIRALFGRHDVRMFEERPLALFSWGGIYDRLLLDPQIRPWQRFWVGTLLHLDYPVSRMLPDQKVFFLTTARQPSTHAQAPVTRNKVVVVLPAYNLEKSIGDIVKRTRPFCDDVIVVADGSRDATGARAREAGATVPEPEATRGKGFAVIKGIQAARGLNPDVVILMDSDGQHLPEEIPGVVAPLADEQVDMVVGSRMLGVLRTSTINKFGNWGLKIISFCVTGRWMTDTESGFRAFRADKLFPLKLTSRGYEIESELLLKALHLGYRIKEVPITVPFAVPGVTVWDGVKVAWFKVKTALALKLGRASATGA